GHGQQRAFRQPAKSDGREARAQPDLDGLSELDRRGHGEDDRCAVDCRGGGGDRRGGKGRGDLAGRLLAWSGPGLDRRRDRLGLCASPSRLDAHDADTVGLIEALGDEWANTIESSAYEASGSTTSRGSTWTCPEIASSSSR